MNDPPAPLQGLQSLIFHGVSPKVFREERPMFCVSFVTGSWEEDVTLGDGTQKPQPIWTEVLRRRDTRDHAHATSLRTINTDSRYITDGDYTLLHELALL